MKEISTESSWLPSWMFLQSTLLTLDDSVIDADQIDNLIKFCPTKEEMELLKVDIYHDMKVNIPSRASMGVPTFVPPIF